MVTALAAATATLSVRRVAGGNYGGLVVRSFGFTGSGKEGRFTTSTASWPR
jgi:hypothetical protein